VSMKGTTTGQRTTSSFFLMSVTCAKGPWLDAP